MKTTQGHRLSSNYFIKQPANQTFEYIEFTNVSHADSILPGKWKTIEVENSAQIQRTSFAMATKLHPDAKMYIDFWGNENPYGIGAHQIFCTLVENDPGYKAKYRFVVTTGRHTHSEMSTNKFHYLPDAMKFLVKEMEKTIKKYDKILGEETLMWDMDAIKKHNAFWDITGDTEQMQLPKPKPETFSLKC